MLRQVSFTHPPFRFEDEFRAIQIVSFSPMIFFQIEFSNFPRGRELYLLPLQVSEEVQSDGCESSAEDGKMRCAQSSASPRLYPHQERKIHRPAGAQPQSGQTGKPNARIPGCMGTLLGQK